MASADPPKQKKRNPPTFPYHRPAQARKLKAQWVEREKIKSKWRAEKRRDPSLRPPRPFELAEEGEDKRGKEEEEEEEEEWSGIQESTQPPPKPARPQTVDRKAAIAQSRELAREAYSPASLHHHKSRFDHRRPRKQTFTPRSGGQPNMKLRMNALLDRIQRNTT